MKGGPQLDGAGIVKTAGNEDWRDTGGVSKWSQGSVQVDSGPQLDGAGIIKTAGSEDWRDTGGVSKWSQGSKPRVFLLKFCTLTMLTALLIEFFSCHLYCSDLKIEKFFF